MGAQPAGGPVGPDDLTVVRCEVTARRMNDRPSSARPALPRVRELLVELLLEQAPCGGRLRTGAGNQCLTRHGMPSNKQKRHK
jgi:hypothetical protein